MNKAKVCILGGFAVGKTSLIQQFVNSIFNEKYLTTLGVKIDSKTVSINDTDIDLILWDLAGEDEFMKVRLSYLRNSSAIILVVDGTREETLKTALKLKDSAINELGDIPVILLVNKNDLIDQWTINQDMLKHLESEGLKVLQTSAMNGENVDDAFIYIADQIIQNQG